MRITEGKVSIFLGLLGLAGGGAMMIAPHALWIGWGLIGSAVLGLVVLALHHVLARGDGAQGATVTNTRTQTVYNPPVIINHNPSDATKHDGLSDNVYILALDVGNDGQYSTTNRIGLQLYSHNRTINLCVKNTSDTKTISGCKVQLLNISPREYVGPWLLKEDINIAPGDHLFVPLVSYTEPDDITKTPAGDSFMVIQSTNKYGRPTPSADQEHVIKIRATAFESPPAELDAKIWVDSAGRMRIQKLGGPRDEESWLPLREAARRAFEVTEGTTFAEINFDMGKTELEKIELVIGMFLTAKLQMRGKSPPSNIAREIPAELMSHLTWTNNQDAFHSIFASEPGRYVSVEVSSVSLGVHLDELRRLGSIKL